MSTLTQLIKKNYQRPIRRCYIKRRDFNGNYESDWIRIDFWKNRDRVINWGSISIEINHIPGDISTFDVSNLTMTFDNSIGHFNNETFNESIWNGWIGRKFTKLKIETGYLDTDGTEVGVANIFEGIIHKVSISENQTAKVTILSYQTIIKKYDILDLSLASTDRDIADLVNDIMNQAKITKFIPYVAATPGISGITIDDPSLLEGTYWENILYFAEISNSIPLLVGDTWAFTSRTPSALSQWDFKGFGTNSNPDIFKINSYDDEGADKVRLRFQEDGGSTVAIADDQILLTKYLGDTDGAEVQFINMENIKAADKQTTLNELVDYWKDPRPVIDFDTRFMVNFLKPTDKITIEFKQQIIPKVGAFIIGISRLGLIVNGGDSHVLGRAIGAINIASGINWMVTKIVKDIQNWISRIKAERIPV